MFQTCQNVSGLVAVFFLTINIYVLGLWPYSWTAFPVQYHTYSTHSKFNFFLGSSLVDPILHMYRGGLWPHCDSGSTAQVFNLDSSSAAGAVQGRTAWGHSARVAGKASSSTGSCPHHLDHYFRLPRHHLILHGNCCWLMCLQTHHYVSVFETRTILITMLRY